MQVSNFILSLTSHVKARYALIGISSHEDERVLEIIETVGRQIEADVYCWTHAKGLERSGSSNIDIKTLDLKACIDRCEEICRNSQRSSIFVFFDVAIFLESRSNPIYRRRFRDFAQSIRSLGYKANCLFISPAFELPLDMQKEVVILDLPLPLRVEIQDIINSFCEQWKNYPNVDVDQNAGADSDIIDACLGLTKVEIENSLARCLVHAKSFSIREVNLILEEKRQIIRQNGILEFISYDKGINNVGGLNGLKQWLHVRKKCFSEEAKRIGIKNPKGVLLVGIPGCGKSLVAKCISNSWSMPLLRLDMSKIYQGTVGASENNIRSSLKTVSVISPCILWIDELDKSLGTGTNGESDGGTSSRVFGTILTWMQENTAPVFVFATANDISRLPPELLRKGRFDEIFFVDLPSEEERRDILAIHLDEVGQDPSQFDLNRLAYDCGPAKYGEGVSLTGAEIESWIQMALINQYSYNDVNRSDALSFQLTTQILLDELDNIIPLAKQRAREFSGLREWANVNAVSATKNQNSKRGAELEFGAGRRLTI